MLGVRRRSAASACLAAAAFEELERFRSIRGDRPGEASRDRGLRCAVPDRHAIAEEEIVIGFERIPLVSCGPWGAGTVRRASIEKCSRLLLGLGACLALAALPARAQQPLTSCSTGSIALQTTAWSHNLDLPRFDPVNGVLVGVRLDLHAHIEGSARAENLEPGPSNL